ncbi:hypothetical protein GPECTOR_32g463 [Gonium pectorale]|uniref:HECT-type E3 ubiquitin transferase n=1 Tax=Gonium pectorale TaxID=33097 RepID=A0A150GDB5_GONPE|nr:hypothetical protein GPECTOR_32g463 [Gonium pectorale]|eukprot:KXZ47851.1 hypothetical protein GPECTOR_32g463 [Gonium pectorale]
MANRQGRGQGLDDEKAIMQGLRQMDDEGSQLSALSELNELLSISTEDNLAAFPTESMVPLLIQLLNAEHNPDIMLMAARALTFLADVLPQSCGAIVRHGAVPAFCARLLTIEYIDLAEQSLQALEKLSHDHSPSLLQNGGLLAVLSYLDFFPTGVQRTATATAANICRSLMASPSTAASSTAQSAIKEAIPILTGLLHYSDAKVVDNACVSLSYIAEASAGQPALLEALTTGGLVGQALQLIGLSDTGAMTSQLSLSTYYGLLKLLSTAASSSASVATTLLDAGALSTIRTLLATSPLLMAGPGGGGGSALLRTPDQLHEVLALLSELLPPVQDSQALVSSNSPLELPQQQAGAVPRGRGQELQAHMLGHPLLTMQLCGEVLPLVLTSYSATVISEVRSRALRVLLQLLTACPPGQLRDALRDLPLASFLASLLTGRDTATAAVALHCCELLMLQLPDVFKHVFLKEGVAHAIEQISASAAAQGAGVAVASAGSPLPAGAASPTARPAVPQAPPAEEQRRMTRSSAAAASARDEKATASPGATAAAAQAASTAASAAANAVASAAAQAAGGPSSRAPAGNTSPNGLALRAFLAARALRFKRAHYDSGCGAPETEGLLQVRDLLKRLPAEPTATLSKLMALMAPSGAGCTNTLASGLGAAAPAGVSVFELLNSGAVKELYDFLTGVDLPPSDDRPTAVLRRIAALARAGLTPTDGSPCNPPLVGLVRKLQAALSSVETFPVHYGRAAPPASGGYRSGGGAYGGRAGSAGSGSALNPGSLSSGLSMLTHPFKLRLCRHSSDNTLRDYSTNIVLIEPLATMSAIEEFLWPRVYRGSSAVASAAAAAAQAAQRQREQQQQEAAAAAATAAAAAKPADGVADKATGAAAKGGPGNRSNPIPVDDSASSRRVTRSQEAAAAGAVGGGDDVEERRARGSGGGSEHDGEDHDDDDDSPDGDLDAEMEDAGAGGDAMFDEGDEDFDEDGMDGDDGDPDIGNMHVHDLHVDQQPAGGAAAPAQAQGSAAAGAGPPVAATAAAAAGAQASAEPSAAAAGRPAGAWASRLAAAGASAAAAGAPGAAAGADSGAGGAARSAAHEAAAPRMVFSFSDAPLASACTVFQAIQQGSQQQGGSGDGNDDGEEDGGGQRQGRRLWEEIHTLYYRPAGSAEAEAQAEAGASAAARTASRAGTAAAPAGPAEAAGSSSAQLGPWADTPLRELLVPRLPAELTCPPACREVLALMALLEAVNRLGPRACAELQAAGIASDGEQAAGPLESVRHVPRDEYVSAKLSSKLGQQLKDVLSICGGGMPGWCGALAAPCRFLFPFEIRKRYFYCTAFGLGRALQHMQQLHTAEAGGAPGGGHGGGDRDGRELRVGRLQRQKVRVSRKRILESAAKVMELYARSRAVLELEYFNEVGTGLGPTLEFYTLLSHELQRKDLSMWRHEEQDDTQQPEQQQEDEAPGAASRGSSKAPSATASPARGPVVSPDRMDVDGGAGAAARAGPAPVGVSVPSRRGEAATHDESEYVNAPWGLFPRPLLPAARGSSAGLKVVENFRLLGRTLAKALQDNRLLDLPLSHVFYAAALGSPLDLWDIARFDAGLGATLARLHAALAAHRSSGSPEPLRVDDVALEDLCITFVLPGQPDYPLREGGADMVVSTAEQLNEYIEAVVDATLRSGVAAQLAAFREGFNEVFSLSTLSLFHEDEIEVLLCGSGERWTMQVLSEAIKFDHGYTASSQPVRFLLEILSELDTADQRAFLRFVTGCPRLPPGGLPALHPRLTVVRKHPSGGDGPSNGPTPVGSFQEAGLVGAGGVMCAADADLPSVMTCANYIKLPPYSSKAVMASRLMYAIREGQGSFDLS